jgi:hypothetical protein
MDSLPSKLFIAAAIACAFTLVAPTAFAAGPPGFVGMTADDLYGNPGT